MRILISGSSGLIGRAVSAALGASGHNPVPLRRTPVTNEPESPFWEPIARQSWESDIGPVEAVIHLAGENLAAHRWNPAVKKRLRDGRVIGTHQLASHLAGLKVLPRVFISASATGYYGNRDDEILTEASPRGTGFLSDLCRDWEDACRPASDAGIRTVNLRFGMVLARGGGALGKLLPLFRMGLGGRLGSGRQWMSWIALDDLVGVVLRTIEDANLKGPINVVAPEPVTNREFTKALGAVLRRPTIMAAPGWGLRLAVGEIADEMLLSSARVTPKTLLDSGFRFKHGDLTAALRHIIFTHN